MPKSRSVTLERSSKQGFGFTLAGQGPCFLTNVTPDGVAGRAGLHNGDQLVGIDSEDIRQCAHSEIAMRMAEAGPRIRLTVIHRPPAQASSASDSSSFHHHHSNSNNHHGVDEFFGVGNSSIGGGRRSTQYQQQQHHNNTTNNTTATDQSSMDSDSQIWKSQRKASEHRLFRRGLRRNDSNRSININNRQQQQHLLDDFEDHLAPYSIGTTAAATNIQQNLSNRYNSSSNNSRSQGGFYQDPAAAAAAAVVMNSGGGSRAGSVRSMASSSVRSSSSRRAHPVVAGGDGAGGSLSLDVPPLDESPGRHRRHHHHRQYRSRNETDLLSGSMRQLSLRNSNNHRDHHSSSASAVNYNSWKRGVANSSRKYYQYGSGTTGSRRQQPSNQSNKPTFNTLQNTRKKSTQIGTGAAAYYYGSATVGAAAAAANNNNVLLQNDQQQQQHINRSYSEPDFTHPAAGGSTKKQSGSIRSPSVVADNITSDSDDDHSSDDEGSISSHHSYASTTSESSFDAEYMDPNLIFQCVLVYIGAVPIPHLSTVTSKRATIRSALQSLKAQRAKARTVLFRVFADCVIVQNSRGEITHRLRSSHIVFSAACAENKQYFGICTSHHVIAASPSTAKNNPTITSAASTSAAASNGVRNSSKSSAEGMSSTAICHMFAADPQLQLHSFHHNYAKKFNLKCSRDPESGYCLEFPYISNSILHALAYSCRNNYWNSQLNTNRQHQQQQQQSGSQQQLQTNTLGRNKEIKRYNSASDSGRDTEETSPTNRNANARYHVEESMPTRGVINNNSGRANTSSLRRSQFSNSRLQHAGPSPADWSANANGSSYPKVTFATDRKQQSPAQQQIKHLWESGRVRSSSSLAAVSSSSRPATNDDKLSIDTEDNNTVGRRKGHRSDTISTSGSSIETQQQQQQQQQQNNPYLTSDIESVLKDPFLRQPFQKFLEQQFCAENLSFWIKAESFKFIPDDKEKSELATDIFNSHFRSDCQQPVNVDSNALQQIKNAVNSGELCKPSLFGSAQQQIFHLLKYDCWPRFIKSDFALPTVIPTTTSVDGGGGGENESSKNGNNGSNGKHDEKQPTEKRKSLLPWKGKLTLRRHHNKKQDQEQQSVPSTSVDNLHHQKPASVDIEGKRNNNNDGWNKSKQTSVPIQIPANPSQSQLSSFNPQPSAIKKSNSSSHLRVEGPPEDRSLMPSSLSPYDNVHHQQHCPVCIVVFPNGKRETVALDEAGVSCRDWLRTVADRYGPFVGQNGEGDCWPAAEVNTTEIVDQSGEILMEVSNSDSNGGQGQLMDSQRLLADRTIRLRPLVFFKIELTNNLLLRNNGSSTNTGQNAGTTKKQIAVRARPDSPSGLVLRPVLEKYGLELDKSVVCFAGTTTLLTNSAPIKVAKGQKLLVLSHDQFTEWLHNDTGSTVTASDSVSYGVGGPNNSSCPPSPSCCSVTNNSSSSSSNNVIRRPPAINSHNNDDSIMLQQNRQTACSVSSADSASCMSMMSASSSTSASGAGGGSITGGFATAPPENVTALTDGASLVELPPSSSSASAASSKRNDAIKRSRQNSENEEPGMMKFVRSRNSHIPPSTSSSQQPGAPAHQQSSLLQTPAAAAAGSSSVRKSLGSALLQRSSAVFHHHGGGGNSSSNANSAVSSRHSSRHNSECVSDENNCGVGPGGVYTGTGGGGKESTWWGGGKRQTMPGGTGADMEELRKQMKQDQRLSTLMNKTGGYDDQRASISSMQNNNNNGGFDPFELPEFLRTQQQPTTTPNVLVPPTSLNQSVNDDNDDEEDDIDNEDDDEATITALPKFRTKLIMGPPRPNIRDVDHGAVDDQIRGLPDGIESNMDLDLGSFGDGGGIMPSSAEADALFGDPAAVRRGDNVEWNDPELTSRRKLDDFGFCQTTTVEKENSQKQVNGRSREGSFVTAPSTPIVTSVSDGGDQQSAVSHVVVGASPVRRGGPPPAYPGRLCTTSLAGKSRAPVVYLSPETTPAKSTSPSASSNSSTSSSSASSSSSSGNSSSPVSSNNSHHDHRQVHEFNTNSADDDRQVQADFV